MANYYGASYIVDSYVMAIAIPNILLGGIFVAIATAFTPVFSLIHEKEGSSEANKFTSQLINLLIIFSLVAMMLGLFFSDQITGILASGFTGETAKLTSFFIKITFSYALFTSVAGLLDAFMQYKGYFLKPIISGYFQNIGVICVIIISAWSSYYYLAFGTLLGAIFRLLYIGINAHKAGFVYQSNWTLNEPIKNIMAMAIPVFVGSYILQINTFVDKTLASSLQEGSIAALNYGMILISFITGMTVTLLVTLIYPKITKACTLQDWDGFNRIVSQGIKYIIIIAVPFSMGILVFSKEVVQVIYERGAFDEVATHMTAGTFFYYGIGLVFFALNDLMAKVYYAMKNSTVPIVCSGISVIINIALNLILVQTMAQNGLALATSIASALNSAMLYIWIRRRRPDVVITIPMKDFLTIGIASIVSVGSGFGVYTLLINQVWMPRILYLGLGVMTACLIYGAILLKLKVVALPRPNKSVYAE